MLPSARQSRNVETDGTRVAVRTVESDHGGRLRPLAAVAQGDIIPLRELVGHGNAINLQAYGENGDTENLSIQALTIQPLEIVMRWMGCLLSRAFLSKSVGQTRHEQHSGSRTHCSHRPKSRL